MKIDKDTVKHIGDLARIDLDEKELESYTEQLAKIVSYIEKINELDLDNIPSALNPHEGVNVYRNDTASAFDNIPGLINLFPEREENFIRIPKVID